MSGFTRNGVTYNSEREADLAAVIPSVYIDRPLDAGYIAEAIIASDWFVAVKAEVAAKVRNDALMALSWSGETTWRQARSAVDAALSASADPSHDVSGT